MVPKIVIDPGHGGDDPGALGADSLKEKDLNLAVALKVRALLARRSLIGCLLTRADDSNPELLQRSTIANADPANVLFVSVHHNAAGDPSARGAELYYQYRSPDSAALAAIMQRQLSVHLGLPWRKTTFRLNSAGTSDYYSVLRNTRCPSVLAELGFVTCPEEAALLRDPSFQDRAAVALTLAIEDWMHCVWRGV
ncbi:MAG TPA: N-acetylmuramoyl-L-alanine amidase [Bacillota bacterium]|jgi:N-acetylmuramoyl-L-alanine amidase